MKDSQISLLSRFYLAASLPPEPRKARAPCYHPIIPSSDKTYEISTHKKKDTQKKDRLYGVWRLYTIPYHTIITLPPPINLRQKPTLTHTLPHHSIVTSVAPRSLSLFYILSIFRKLPSIHSLSSSFRILLSVLVPLQGLPLSVYYDPCPQVRLPT